MSEGNSIYTTAHTAHRHFSSVSISYRCKLSGTASLYACQWRWLHSIRLQYVVYQLCNAFTIFIIIQTMYLSMKHFFFIFVPHWPHRKLASTKAFFHFLFSYYFIFVLFIFSKYVFVIFYFFFGWNRKACVVVYRRACCFSRIERMCI